MKIIPGYKLREIAGEKMIVMPASANLDLTRVVTLNSSAELLWTTFQERGFTKSEAVNLLITKYNISKSQADTDAELWITSMLKAGLIEL